MTSEVVYLGDLKTEATHLLSGVKIVTDPPPDNQGKGEAFSPTDLCATSLANCMLTIMGISARNRSIDITGARAEVTKEMASNPRRIARIGVKVIMPARDFDTDTRKILEAAARSCPVAFSLSAEIEQDITFEWL